MTILKRSDDRATDSGALALAALGWILADERRAQRFLDLTGLSPDGLRSCLEQPATHRAVFDFLCAHEPDLVEAAEALGIDPAQVAAAREDLASGEDMQ